MIFAVLIALLLNEFDIREREREREKHQPKLMQLRSWQLYLPREEAFQGAVPFFGFGGGGGSTF